MVQAVSCLLPDSREWGLPRMPEAESESKKNVPFPDAEAKRPRDLALLRDVVLRARVRVRADA
jgi:hypothetical protein